MLIKKKIIKLIKIINKHIFIGILVAYTPLPFLDIFNFYNEVDPEDISDVESKENSNNANFYFKLKLIAFGIGVLIICYIIFTNNTDIPDIPVTGKNTQISNLYKMQQDQIMQNRLDNALKTTKTILEIKRNIK